MQFKDTGLVAWLSEGLRCVQGAEVGNIKIPSFVWLRYNGGVLALRNSPENLTNPYQGFLCSLQS